MQRYELFCNKGDFKVKGKASETGFTFFVVTRFKG